MLEFFKLFYEIAFEMRYRTKLPYWLKWIRELFRFFQLIFFYVDPCRVESISTRAPTILRLINNAGLLNSWIDDVRFTLSSALILLVLQSIVISMFMHSTVRIKKGLYVIQNVLYLYMIFIDVYIPIVQVPVTFQLDRQLVYLIQTRSFLDFLIFFLLLIAFCAIFVVDYYASVFVHPRIFVVHSMIDDFNGDTEPLLFLARYLSITTQILLQHYYTPMLEFVILGCYPIFIIILLEMRISKGIHITVFGAILKDSPLFASMFTLIGQNHPKFFFSPWISAVISIACYTIIFLLYKLFLRKYSSMILNEKYEPPWWLPLRNSLVMRSAAQTTADIKGFELYTTFRMKQNPEEFIEILRFLGIFKSQRSKLLLMISMWKGNSLYFDYQFYVFSRLFQSYDIPCPQNYIDILDRLHRHYLVTLSLFWQYRFEKNSFQAFVYATKCAFTHTELINLSKYLAFVYQYDANAANAYSEIALIAMGEPLQSVIYRRYATKLNENPGSVVDPIFRRFSNYYPISSEVYNQEISSFNEESKSDNDNANSTSRLRFHFDNKSVIYRDEESDNSPMAMFVQKSDRLKRFSIYFSFSFAIIWSIIFSRNVSLVRSSKLVKIEEAKRLLHLSAEYSLNLTACFVVEPILSTVAYTNLQNFLSFNFLSGLNGLQNYVNLNSLHDQRLNILLDETKVIGEKDPNQFCEKLMIKIFKGIEAYRFAFRDDYFFHARAISVAADLTAFFHSKYSGNCHVFVKLLMNHTSVIYEIIDGLNKTSMEFNKLISEQISENEMKKMYKKFFIVIIVFTFLGVFASICTTMMQMNITFRELPSNAIEFLGSKDRLSLLLLKKSLESWDLFRLIYPLEKSDKPIENPVQTSIVESPHQVKSRIKVAKYSSETNLNLQSNKAKSHHINLQDTKLTISFIGTDQLLKPSQFALMSPFVSDSSSTKSTFSDASERDYTESEVVTRVSPQKEEKKEELMVSNTDFVTKTIVSTTLEYKNFYFFIVLVFLVPWIVKIFMAVYLGYALTYEKTNEQYVLKNISSLYSQLQEIPNNIFKEFEIKYDINLEKLYNEQFNQYYEKNNINQIKEEFDKNIENNDLKNDKNYHEKFDKNIENNDIESDKNLNEKFDKNIEYNDVENDKNLYNEKFDNDVKNNYAENDKSLNEKFDKKLDYDGYQKFDRNNFVPAKKSEIFNFNFSLGEKEIEKFIHNMSMYYKEILPLSDNFNIIDLNVQTGMKSFIFIIIFFYLILAFGVYKMEYFFRIGYESLFHFPLRYLEDLLKERDEPPPQKFPTNSVIEVVIDTTTNLINNVSPNLYNMTGCYPLDVIGRKYDEIFPLIQKQKRDNSENRTFYVNFRKSKNFIEDRNVVGRTTRVILYDKYDDKNDIVNLLTRHIPHEIAKIYCEEGNISRFHSQGYFLVCKFNNTDYNSSVELVFKSIHNIMQCYSTAHMVGIEGSIIKFVFSGTDRIVPIFFIRDLLNIQVCNQYLDNFVVFRGSISGEIVIRDEEPYVFSRVSSKSTNNSASFCVCNRSILFVDDCLHLCDEFSGERIEGNHSLRGFQIKFEELENVVCNIY